VGASLCGQHASTGDSCAFGIVQGALTWGPAHGTPGCDCRDAVRWRGLGGLSVGEPPETCMRWCARSARRMPEARPRYLMGVGTPKDLLVAITSGIGHVRLRDAHSRCTQRRLFVRGGTSTRERGSLHRRAPHRRRLCLRGVPALQPRLSAHLFRVKEILYYRLATLQQPRALPFAGAGCAPGDHCGSARRVHREQNRDHGGAQTALSLDLEGKSASAGYMAKRVGVVLSGCGSEDGSEVREAVPDSSVARTRRG